MLFKLSNMNSNFALTLGYLNSALNNSAQVDSTTYRYHIIYSFKLPKPEEARMKLHE